MNIATQGGSIIVKDGLLAENCGCCGGWYCVTCPYPTVIPDQVRVTISTNSTDSYAWGRTVESSGGNNAISHTAFMFGAIGGTYTLTGGGTAGGICTYSYSDDKVSLSLSLNTDGKYEQYVWELFFESAYLRRVEEYGQGGTVRTQEVMRSASWNSGAPAGQFRFYDFNNPTFWRTQGAVSVGRTPEYAPYIFVRQLCDCRQSTIRGQLGWRNNTQAVYLSGQQCGTDRTASSGSACDISLSGSGFPVSGVFKRFDDLATSYADLSWPPQLQQVNGFNFSSDAFELSYTIQSVVLVSGSQTIPLPFSTP